MGILITFWDEWCTCSVGNKQSLVSEAVQHVVHFGQWLPHLDMYFAQLILCHAAKAILEDVVYEHQYRLPCRLRWLPAAGVAASNLLSLLSAVSHRSAAAESPVFVW